MTVMFFYITLIRHKAKQNKFKFTNPKKKNQPNVLIMSILP